MSSEKGYYAVESESLFPPPLHIHKVVVVVVVVVAVVVKYEVPAAMFGIFVSSHTHTHTHKTTVFSPPQQQHMTFAMPVCLLFPVGYPSSLFLPTTPKKLGLVRLGERQGKRTLLLEAKWECRYFLTLSRVFLTPS